MKPRRRRWSAVAATLVLLGILVEIIARVVLGLGTPPLVMTDPDIEYLFHPSQDVQRFGNRQLYNRYSMRNEDFPIEKPAGEYRILCMGDSVLNGGNLTDHDALATTRLEAQLNAVWTNRVRVANISAGSWGVPNLLAYARRYGLFDADQLVVQLSSHDLYDVPDFQPLDPNTHPTKKPFCATWEGITRYLPRYLPFSKPESADPTDLPNRPERKEVALEALSELHAMAHDAGIPLLIVLHCERGELGEPSGSSEQEIFKTWAHEANVDVIELGSAEFASLQSGVDPYENGGKIHLNSAGQQLMADALFYYLLKSNEGTVAPEKEP